jgi:hypothetical protein
MDNLAIRDENFTIDGITNMKMDNRQLSTQEITVNPNGLLLNLSRILAFSNGVHHIRCAIHPEGSIDFDWDDIRFYLTIYLSFRECDPKNTDIIHFLQFFHEIFW